jgi:hypothetical protein
MTGKKRACRAWRVVVAGWVVLAPAGLLAQGAGTQPPPADQPAGTQSLGRAGAWSAYVSNDKTGRVCYLVGQPQKSEPAGFARRAPSALVTHRPAEKIANVVSFVEGYTLKDGSDVALDVGGSKFDLFTKDDSAWARTSETDKTIVGTLSKARQAVIAASRASVSVANPRNPIVRPAIQPICLPAESSTRSLLSPSLKIFSMIVLL